MLHVFKMTLAILLLLFFAVTFTNQSEITNDEKCDKQLQYFDQSMEALDMWAMESKICS